MKISAVVLLSFSLLFFQPSIAQKLLTPFEKSKEKESPSYFEIIKWWQQLDRNSQKVKMQPMVPTDAGYPLHLITISNTPIADFKTAHNQNKIVILINNGIHPGEPEGIDATMLLARDIAKGRLSLPDNVILAVIPVYNIGGCLNRSKFYRVDQDGPIEMGSRGNSQNLDLNRDFIKCDSKEALSFTEIFHLTNPDILIDNHASNGADYQHVITLLTTQYNKLGGALGDYLNDIFEPGLQDLMKKDGYDLVPYVNFFGYGAVENGWSGYWDSPRYSSGYAALFQTFSFVPETHILKPFNQRVRATYMLMKNFIAFAHKNGTTIKRLRNEVKERVKADTEFPISYKLDSTKTTPIIFKGFETGFKKSEITGLNRMYYDRTKPYTKTVPFYSHYKPINYIRKPKAYIIPQGWWKVIDRLKANKVIMTPLERDTTLTVETYYIQNYQTAPKPYQMHHINSQVETVLKKEQHRFQKGDYQIMMNQTANRFLIETLEPQAEDSYFVWNFFDGILNSNEWFSDYHYEDIAYKYLKQNPDLWEELKNKQKTDSVFAKNGMAQLSFIFNNSPYKDRIFMRYPISRLPE